MDESSIGKANYIELILRLAMANLRSRSSLLHEELPEFIETNFVKDFSKLDVISVRKNIRASKRLNKFLLQNKVGIRRIYSEFVQSDIGPNAFTL